MSVLSYGSRSGLFAETKLPGSLIAKYQPATLDITMPQPPSAPEGVVQTVNQVLAQGNSTISASNSSTPAAGTEVVLPLIASGGADPLKLADAGNLTFGGTEGSFGGGSSSSGSSSGGDKPVPAAAKATGKPPPKKFGTCGP